MALSEISGSGALKESSVAGGSSQVVFRKATAKVVNNTVADTDLLNSEFTLAANALGVNGFLRVMVTMDWLNNVGASSGPRLKFKWGGTTFLDLGPGNSSAASTQRRPTGLVIEIQNLGVTNSQLITVKGWSGVAVGVDNPYTTSFTTGVGQWYAGASSSSSSAFGQATATVDTTAAQAVVVSVVNAQANASYETKLYHAIAEIL